MANDVTKTVIYTVKIADANPGAWYAKLKGETFNCTLDFNEKQFSGGLEILFKVLGAFRPVKFIKQQHCIVVSQHIASHSELMCK